MEHLSLFIETKLFLKVDRWKMAFLRIYSCLQESVRLRDRCTYNARFEFSRFRLQHTKMWIVPRLLLVANTIF